MNREERNGMEAYLHKVQYYETDRMGVVHHSNYIRWMEEARVDFMDRLGFPYARMEEEGILSPVRSVSCVYKKPSGFGDEIRVFVRAEPFTGAALTIGYEMRNQREELVCEARSEHVFLSREGRILRMKKVLPDFCEALEEERGKES